MEVGLEWDGGLGLGIQLRDRELEFGLGNVIGIEDGYKLVVQKRFEPLKFGMVTQ